RVTRQASRGSPSASVLLVITATGSTHGMSSFCRVRNISYSLLASSAEVSLMATTYPLRWANRTRWREIPLGRAAIDSSGHSSSGRFHGRSSRAESTVAEVMLRLMRAPNRSLVGLVETESDLDKPD